MTWTTAAEVKTEFHQFQRLTWAGFLRMHAMSAYEVINVVLSATWIQPRLPISNRLQVYYMARLVGNFLRFQLRSCTHLPKAAKLAWAKQPHRLPYFVEYFSYLTTTKIGSKFLMASTSSDAPGDWHLPLGFGEQACIPYSRCVHTSWYRKILEGGPHYKDQLSWFVCSFSPPTY